MASFAGMASGLVASFGCPPSAAKQSRFVSGASLRVAAPRPGAGRGPRMMARAVATPPKKADAKADEPKKEMPSWEVKSTQFEDGYVSQFERGGELKATMFRQGTVKAFPEGWKEEEGVDLTLPALDKPMALKIYKDMQLGRQFEDMCAQMYYRGKMFGFVHLYNGQEAVSSGCIAAWMDKKDYVVSTYRDHVHALSKGCSANAVMAELFGKATGVSKGMGGSMHMFDKEHGVLGGFAFIGEGIPVACGSAFQTLYRKRVLREESANQVTAAFFGDGTANNGQFFECLNMAALWKLPVIFCIENNGWAIGMAHERATSDPVIYRKGPAFNMPGIQVDGNDVLATREAFGEACARARTGGGPTVIEFMTYRQRGHSLADPDELRDKREKAWWAERDPIKRFEKEIATGSLKGLGITKEELKEIEKEIEKVVEDAVEFGENSPEPDPSQMFDFTFAAPIDAAFGTGHPRHPEYKTSIQYEMEQGLWD